MKKEYDLPHPLGSQESNEYHHPGIRAVIILSVPENYEAPGTRKL